MAATHDVWVITHSRNRPKINAYLAQHASPRLRFVFHPAAKGSLFHGDSWLFGIQMNYYFWQRSSRALAKVLHREIGFDVAHHTVWARYWMPTGLAGLGVPLVWGPVGAGDLVPRSLINGLPLRWRALELLRRVAQNIGHFDPALRRTARESLATLVTTKATGDRVKGLGARVVYQMPTVFFSCDEIEYFRSLPPSDESLFKAICVGRLVHWKGFHLAIQGFAQFHRSHANSELWIVNDGPERKRLEELAAREGVSDCVRFWGKLTNLREVHTKMSQCQVLLHPALHESFGNVCLEAMAIGRAVVCLDIAGPATQVTAATGFRIRARSEPDAVRGIAGALSNLFCDRGTCTAMGLAGQQRVADEFSSRVQLGWLDRLYSSVATVPSRSPVVECANSDNPQ